MSQNPTRKSALKPRIDCVGLRFGRLVVTSLSHHDGHSWVWHCRCDCGGECFTPRPLLQAGGRKSCGCLRNEVNRARCRTHGLSMSPEYRVWNTMKNRCHNPATKSFPHYGAKGITVCDRWRDSFEAFIGDMGRRPSPRHSIERLDNDRGYSPDNCIWGTKVQQMNNRGDNHFIEYDGLRMTAAQWARRQGIKSSTILMRLVYGWSVESALTIPPDPRRRKVRPT